MAATRIVVTPVRSRLDLERFVRFPWVVNRNDPNWVPPLLRDRRKRLDPKKHPFWRSAVRELFLARQGSRVVGTIAAIHDSSRAGSTSAKDGAFGFFECIDDVDVARALLDAAASWLRARGLERMVGPFSPSGADEFGVLIGGFATRPAIAEAHNPAYYARLVEGAGLTKHHDAYAWLVKAPAGTTVAADLLPKKLRFVADAVKRAEIRSRPVDMSRWDDEVELTLRLMNASLKTVREFVPIALEDFRALANSFKSFVDPELIRFMEVDGTPVAMALAFPDVNEALQVANGRLFPFGLLRMMRKARRLTRATFKVLVVLPEYRRRGLDAVLVLDVAQAMIDHGFREADLSMTGEENDKINGYLKSLGLKVYRTVRTYQRALVDAPAAKT